MKHEAPDVADIFLETIADQRRAIDRLLLALSAERAENARLRTTLQDVAGRRPMRAPVTSWIEFEEYAPDEELGASPSEREHVK